VVRAHYADSPAAQLLQRRGRARCAGHSAEIARAIPPTSRRDGTAWFNSRAPVYSPRAGASEARNDPCRRRRPGQGIFLSGPINRAPAGYKWRKHRGHLNKYPDAIGPVEKPRPPPPPSRAANHKTVGSPPREAVHQCPADRKRGEGILAMRFRSGSCAYSRSGRSR